MLERLSPREQDVWTLLTQHLTDREIAERLVLGQRTVERHVGSILERLEASAVTKPIRSARTAAPHEPTPPSP